MEKKGGLLKILCKIICEIWHSLARRHDQMIIMSASYTCFTRRLVAGGTAMEKTATRTVWLEGRLDEGKPFLYNKGRNEKMRYPN